ncbi:FecR family protein [Pedobacter nyackensis]|uniref:FecR family protein n=2 Tax=Pedobacter nyackensis TaxID=475255 RepID=A0A1W2F427_9SPHI|nr:FecR family protein [Pedobacter nyackensis]
MDKHAFMQLAGKVTDGTATEQELSLYSNYINHFKSDTEWDDQLMGNEEATKLQLFEMINSVTEMKVIPFYKHRTFSYLVAACIALISITIGIIFYNNYTQHSGDKNRTVLKNDIAPGGNKAILTLADGSQVLLSDADNGKIAEEAGISITKSKDGQLIYQVNNPALAAATGNEPVVTYNTISTPRGGQYQVLLPDGTQVWLNASSSLKFPTSFIANQRNVMLTGEAYFEVSRNKKKPFIVNVGEMKVEVLGTHFDVMAYPDEQSINTTLIEGSVKVARNNESRILKPGQQAIVGDEMQVVKAAGDVIAWKNGLTSFKDADIRTIMRQVARWYDVEVNYEGEIPRRLFTGEISRKANLSELIKIIELSNIQLRLEGKTITVMP